MKKKLGWVVVGLGLQGNRLVAAIQNSRFGSVVETASTHEKKSLEAALKNKAVNAVAIATPNNTHAKYAVRAAKQGKHILCEKPLAISTRDVRRIQEAVKKSRVHCFVNYHLRMHPEVQKARRILTQRKLGDLTRIEMEWCAAGFTRKDPPRLPPHMRWRENPAASGGGALMARGVHLFDLLRFLTGEEIREIIGWSDATARTVDRTVIAICILEKGVPAVLTTSKVTAEPDNHVTIYGTKGRLELRALFTDDPQKMYESVFDSFSDALRGKKTFLATLRDGAAAVAAAEAFTKSARKRKTRV